MNNLKEGQEVCISVKALYDNNPLLTFGKIIPDFDENGNINYYDLYNSDWEFACCDGEVVAIDQIGSELITFRNDNGEYRAYFTLTIDEVNLALFN